MEITNEWQPFEHVLLSERTAGSSEPRSCCEDPRQRAAAEVELLKCPRNRCTFPSAAGRWQHSPPGRGESSYSDLHIRPWLLPPCTRHLPRLVWQHFPENPKFIGYYGGLDGWGWEGETRDCLATFGARRAVYEERVRWEGIVRPCTGSPRVTGTGSHGPRLCILQPSALHHCWVAGPPFQCCKLLHQPASGEL